MRQLIWSEGAEADIVEIIEQETTGRTDLLERILEAPTLLLEYPALGRVVGGAGYRKWSIKQTPFLLFYRVNATTVQIIRVLHRASDWASLP